MIVIINDVNSILLLTKYHHLGILLNTRRSRWTDLMPPAPYADKIEAVCPYDKKMTTHTVMSDGDGPAAYCDLCGMRWTAEDLGLHTYLSLPTGAGGVIVEDDK